MSCIKRLAVLVLVCPVLSIAACAKDSEDEIDNVVISPVPTESISPSPELKAGVPLHPMETWCESMMAKPNQEWTKEEAIKFSAQCLYND